MNNEYENLPACFLVFDVTGNWDVTSLRLMKSTDLGMQYAMCYILLSKNIGKISGCFETQVTGSQAQVTYKTLIF